MNPLTLVKRIQNINSKEAALGISEDASWHAKYKDSAYVFVGGIPFDLTEGDLLAVFAQYGEIVDVNLVRDKGTGKSKGFAFVAYEDQRSTNLAVDNLNGAQILGRIIRVDHVDKYKKKEEEDEEKEQKMREERGVCRAFQKGECNRGATCRFSHDEQRCANTGWGSKDTDSKWDHDKYDGPSKSHRRSRNIFEDRPPESAIQDKGSRFRLEDNDGISRAESDEMKRKGERRQREMNPRDQDRLAAEKQLEWKEKEQRRGKILIDKKLRNDQDMMNQNQILERFMIGEEGRDTMNQNQILERFMIGKEGRRKGQEGMSQNLIQKMSEMGEVRNDQNMIEDK
ncbi:zinc finger CCCH domain-containing protein 25-like [Macadamia integrifolia]|uniref:zinc finger CCCH domain-containing protein 25-like n=1 Tax=Macadamia integrifolia TaxID=60698 RepID=UPI001C4FB1D1|nr:zinc finger CCCH domain-containing protein 25-like [Macadamia integrifolia]XP_042492192.1 zinc finger CCCH domain-containing protein 25-like [Macadamia integrifolia]XP_042492193.1 zinc finger CCCH domain-containing protein 25-like [Macadamia integrifolia]XP_042492195.1 zinc finger CCCH domain-containing protein 25-like [Macadamia integrifolia]XP_042492196.1 zinc finger CCCH domain-containing protein 25-like [Macadamia integrifolia]